MKHDLMFIRVAVSLIEIDFRLFKTNLIPVIVKYTINLCMKINMKKMSR